MGSRLESNSSAVRKRIEEHEFANEDGEEYEGSKFGGFGDYFRRKKIKLQNLDADIRAQSTDNPQIFKGIVCHVNGYTQPSLNDLHRMIVAHGGGFIQYLDNKTMVTHIIAANLTPKKAVEFRRYRIVKPAWIVDSIAAGKLQPWDRYRVVDEGDSQKVLRFDNGKVLSQLNQRSRGYRDQTDTSWYTKQLAKSEQTGELLPADQDPDPTAGAETGQLLYHETEPRLRHGMNDDDMLSAVPEDQTSINKNSVDNLLNNDENDIDERGDESLSPRENQPVNEVQPVPQDMQLPLAQTDQPEATADDTILSQVKEIADPVEAEKILGRKLTAEEHNAIFLSDPRIRKSSVLNPDFLEQYYRESRLHHLSTWKAELKSQLQALALEKTASQKALQKRPARARRYILHVDFDSFFVAVSLKTYPDSVDKPCVVAHGTGTGSEIASCNYPARQFGVKNGMWMKRAHELCKDLTVLPYDFPAYEAASREFYDSILNCGGIVQSVSIDEALVDISTICHHAGGTDGTGVREGSIWREQEKADEVGQSIRDQVQEKTGCAVSVGIGGNILQAKVALRKAKPAGQFQLKPEQVLEFLADLEVRSLPGVAYSIGGKLEENGIVYVKDIRQATKEKLVSLLGPRTGEKLWNYARGIDSTEVGDQVVRKSVSAEVNWGVRFETQEQAEEFIENLAGELSRRLLKEKVRGSHLTMKIMKRASDAPLAPPKHLGHGKCDTFNKSVMLGVATSAKETISKEALSIMRSFGFSPGELRGLGLQMTKLEPLKATSGDDRGSQRRLQFFKPAAALPPVEDSGDEPPVPKAADDDPETPKKNRQDEAKAAFAAPVFSESQTPSRKRLNTAGTQFLLPTQVDPNVLKELPHDIRNRLQRHNLSKANPPNASQQESATSTTKPTGITALPNQSQLDPGILEALPADLRDEILAEYEAQQISPSTKQKAGQSVLPQSPRKVRTLQTSARGKGQPGRGRPRGGGGSILNRLRAARSYTPTLTQSNFVATTTTSKSDDAGSNTGSTEDISEDFLAALPDDIRQEILEEQRKQQLARTGGIEVSRKRRLQKLADDSAPKILKLAPREPRPSFTSQKLSSLEQLREAVDAWVKEFLGEGPYKEDVDVLVRYLGDVVSKEKDMNKANNVVKWLQWCLEREEVLTSTNKNDEGSSPPPAPVIGEKARSRWQRALSAVQQAVSDAVKARGLAPLDSGWLIPNS